MKILIDMNLSPEWVEVFERNGLEARHWAAVGDPRAVDFEILKWARDNEHIVFTNDLDFGRLLALTSARGPSILQIRGGRLLPEDAEEKARVRGEGPSVALHLPVGLWQRALEKLRHAS